ncbi:serine/threonine-protein kinase [Arthrobacter sp. ISL-95]|uniref:serine/threonine-protein kinase n=1 Tax=Arthrobacter sp. ISL-95 TaxID=2819116 RepID=UPI001BE9BA0C|nr:serine/threonine-protein kinase [Arthrobacter sp. ISL-95]MBT2588030.1 serine/threonine protein kinase [Arthrobacter sp. ISL-95]
METLDTPEAMAPHVAGYSISRPLGHGSSATVWLATRDKDGARFAVKCARPDAASGESTATAQVPDDVDREMRLLYGLKHKHLIRVHEVLPVAGMAEGTLGIVMDYAAGGSLGNLISARGKLGIGEAVTILTPIAQALDYLHVNGAEHGDVSPGNVLFTAEGMPLLADFGLAAKVGDKPRDPQFGTPGFMEPLPQASGNAEYSRDILQPQRDVYALGAVGWYCLTGTTPGPERDRPPLMLLVPEVPKALASALEAALDLNPRNRPSARELGTAIFRSAAPEALDLSGAVHASVIPELLTRRGTLGRSPRRPTSWLGVMWRWLPSMRIVGLPAPRRSLRPPRRRGRGGRRLVLVAAMGVVIGAASWIFWQQNGPTTAMVQQAATETGVADPVQAADLRNAQDLSNSQDLPATRDLPQALSEGLQSQNPLAAVPALSAVRDIALGDRRLDLLEAVNAPGSQAEATDKELEKYLRGAGTAFAGLHTTLTALTLDEPPQEDRVLVAVTATTSGYEERLASGEVVSTQQAGVPQQLRLDVVRTDGRWRISGILGAAAPAK